ncbi:MAG: divalent-cation tolerance protein CutA [Methylobacteriaceae bacterium]|nr:divalent-cation tolerance protein CutA [Methylobacteriaceae bacterium]
MSDYILVNVTCPDDAVAHTIARALVEQRLSSCVHVYPDVLSIYRWRGEIHEDRETMINIKTRAGLWEKVQKVILEHHPYEVSVLTRSEITGFNDKAAEWFEEVVEK